MNQNWGNLKTETSDAVRTTVTPEKSDDEFNDALAGLIRKAHGR